MADFIFRIKDKDNKLIQEIVLKVPVLDTAPQGTPLNIECRERGYKVQYVGNYFTKSTMLTDGVITNPVCPPNSHWDATLGKCVEDNIPNPNPVPGTLLYNSDVDIDWSKGSITFDDILGDDSKPNSKYIRCNASGNPTCTLLPSEKALVLSVSGADNHGRLYFGVCNFDCVLEKESMLMDSGADNDSTKVDSRHQYRDVVDDNAPDTKVQGGLGNAWHRNEVNQKGEWVHGKSSGCADEAALKIETGQWYRTRYTVRHDIANKKIYELSEIEYPLGSGYRKVLEQTCTSAPDQFFNKQEFLDWSEFWLRCNTGNTGGKIKHRKIKMWSL